MNRHFGRPTGAVADTLGAGGTMPDWVDRGAYPFANNWVVLPDAHRMHYVDEGRGPALLFVHGTPSWSFEWRHLIRALSAEFRCVAPDLIGFGLSARPMDFAYTPEAHAAEVTQFVDMLGLRDITLVVHDFGGPIGLPLALADDRRVRRVVILNSWMWSLDTDPTLARRARMAGSGLFRILYGRFNFSLRVLMPYAYGNRRALTPAIHRQYLAPFPDAASRVRVLFPLARALLGSSAHYASLANRIERLRRLPVMIIWGTKDRAFGPPVLARWRRELPAANVVTLPVGHWPQEEAPNDVIGALRDFLRESARMLH